MLNESIVRRREEARKKQLVIIAARMTDGAAPAKMTYSGMHPSNIIVARSLVIPRRMNK